MARKPYIPFIPTTATANHDPLPTPGSPMMQTEYEGYRQERRSNDCARGADSYDGYVGGGSEYQSITERCGEWRKPFDGVDIDKE